MKTLLTWLHTYAGLLPKLFVDIKSLKELKYQKFKVYIKIDQHAGKVSADHRFNPFPTHSADAKHSQEQHQRQVGVPGDGWRSEVYET